MRKLIPLQGLEIFGLLLFNCVTSTTAYLYFLLVFTVLIISTCHPVTASKPETTTRIDNVDEIVNAILTADVAKQHELLAFQSVACTMEDGLGGPPRCETGEEKGTSVGVFPVLGPEGHFIRKADLSAWTGIQAESLQAVYRVSETVFRDGWYPAGEYAALFSTEKDQILIVVHIREDGIVRIDYEFSNSLEEILQRDADGTCSGPDKIVCRLLSSS